MSPSTQTETRVPYPSDKHKAGVEIKTVRKGDRKTFAGIVSSTLDQLAEIDNAKARRDRFHGRHERSGMRHRSAKIRGYEQHRKRESREMKEKRQRASDSRSRHGSRRHRSPSPSSSSESPSSASESETEWDQSDADIKIIRPRHCRTSHRRRASHSQRSRRDSRDDVIKGLTEKVENLDGLGRRSRRAEVPYPQCQGQPAAPYQRHGYGYSRSVPVEPWQGRQRSPEELAEWQWQQQMRQAGYGRV